MCGHVSAVHRHLVLLDPIGDRNGIFCIAFTAIGHGIDPAAEFEPDSPTPAAVVVAAVGQAYPCKGPRTGPCPSRFPHPTCNILPACPYVIFRFPGNFLYSKRVCNDLFFHTIFIVYCGGDLMVIKAKIILPSCTESSGAMIPTAVLNSLLNCICSDQGSLTHLREMYRYPSGPGQRFDSLLLRSTGHSHLRLA